MIHYVRLRAQADGGCEYGCRYVRTRGFAEEEKAGRRVHQSLTTKPLPASILRGMASKGIHWARPDAPYWCGKGAGGACLRRRLRGGARGL
jgi:hypothetical protein